MSFVHKIIEKKSSLLKRKKKKKKNSFKVPSDSFKRLLEHQISFAKHFIDLSVN
jgi:hypothetical protein